MLKFLRIAFGVSGTRTAIPDVDPGTGAVSEPTGWGPQYELIKTDPNSRNIERGIMNQALFETQTAVQELQAQGIPDFITTALNGGTPYPYGLYALVRYNNLLYVSRKTANVSLPSVAADWSVFNPQGIRRANAGGTANAVTADFVPDLGTLVDGDQILIQHTAINTSAVTINPDGSGALATYKGAGLPLVGGDIPGANFWGLYVYDASVPGLQLLNPSPTASVGSRTAVLTNGVPWVCPAGVFEILYTGAGGGGAGGGAAINGAAGGGGGGGMSAFRQKLTVVPGTSYASVVGAGGVPGAAGAVTGGTGGVTSLGALISLPGGVGGTGAASAAIEVGGTAGGNTANNGGVGMTNYNGSTLWYIGGAGGGNQLCASNITITATTGATFSQGYAGVARGQGGGGGFTGSTSPTAVAGGAGGAGFSFIEY